ncbi:hypothetical protein [Pseudonocardia humida]|uniref:Transcriptional regulator with AbiEi antitoxin domain of type IV toxin-antitoxin system n=1 Tax=Pseudonocardia humida TaxID=2800819 RepID=A0ABT1A482_9PSEU|nr:hypothetical protein [Pseudonocardia humida]MCO1657574.1 hypothetical protein [Pseudonocardia humida]
MHPDAAAPPAADPRPDPDALRALLDRQAGVLTREQAVGVGFAPAAIDDRLRLRRWLPLHPRVYLVRGSLDPAAAGWAALLWAGPAAVLSGPSAAWWHGLLDEPPDVVTVTVPAVGRRGRPRVGVAVRVRELGRVDVALVRGAPVTALPLTVLDAAVALGARGPALLDGALRGRVRFPAVRAAHRRMRGTPGAARAALLLESAADRSATEAVRLLARLLHRAGPPGWRLENPAAGGPPRITFPAADLAIEARGMAGPAAVRRPGGKVLVYTWHDLVERPSIVLAEIAGAVVVGPDGHPPVISATSGRPGGPLGEQARPAAGYPES